MILKDIDVDVNSHSWVGSTPPTSLSSLTGTNKINIFLVMIHIAFRTSPPQSYGFALGDMWAWFRYFPAISLDSNLKLRPEWQNIDQHQKTILSDDFGMGFSSYVLTNALDLVAVIPTNYLLDRISFFRLGPAEGKRGPKKSPDFIAFDKRLNFHIFECKGTQSSIRDLEDQFKKGKVQKRNVLDPHRLIDQSLVVGMFIPQDGKKEKALLKIEDPEIQLDLSNCNKDELLKIITIGELATYFHLLGFPKLGNAIAVNTPLKNIERTRNEIFSLPNVMFGQKRYIYHTLMQRFDYYDYIVNNKVLYGLEVKFGIEENVINTVLKLEDYIQCTNELYNDFRDLPSWIIYETENGVRVFTPLGCFMEINMIF